MTADMSGPPALGSWARSGGLVGLVVAVDGDAVTLFDPGQRQVAQVGADAVEPLPAAAVTVTVSVDLPVAHGVPEETLRRWLATLTDPVLRARAATALTERGLDAGATLPEPHLEVAPMRTSGAVCLCGARLPAPPGTLVPCPRCGRQAASAPRAGGGGAGGSA